MKRVEDSTTHTAGEIGVALFSSMTIHDASLEGFTDAERAELSARHLAHGRRERRAARVNTTQLKPSVIR